MNKHFAFAPLAALALASSAAAAGFDPSGALGCATGLGGYDEVQKFRIAPAKATGLRDLQVYDDEYADACSQSATEIRCEFRKGLRAYEVTVDLLDVSRLDPDYNGAQWFLRGTISKTLARAHGISCRQ